MQTMKAMLELLQLAGAGLLFARSVQSAMVMPAIEISARGKALALGTGGHQVIHPEEGAGGDLPFGIDRARRNQHEVAKHYRKNNF